MPECVTALSGKDYALAFQTKRAGEAVEQLTIIDLDPNQDRDFSDASGSVKSLRCWQRWSSRDIGLITRFASMMTVRFAVFTNPADGEICLLSLDKLNVVSRHKVGGIPTGIVLRQAEKRVNTSVKL